MESNHFLCDDCGHPVKRMKGGQTFEVRRGINFVLPEDFEIFTCTHCGETYVNQEDCQKIEALYQASLKG